ncbi:hypothetical protein [Burkholderia ambifaria]|uniref:hypothetical protein n=1 Tax=Burkholderia ambifaria TaxID=152480 RepID=UPI00158BCFE4|nr:hypothetical protein [Burkholderia ambifaria]
MKIRFGWSLLRYVLLHHRSPIARLAYRHNVRWVDWLQEAYMRRLVRTGRERDWEIGPDGRVNRRRRSVAIPPSLLAYRRRRNQVPSAGDDSGASPRDRADLEVTCRNLRPDDWQDIWPELIQQKGSD